MRTLQQNVLMVIVGVVIFLFLVIVLIGREQMLAMVFGPVELTIIDFSTLTRHARPNQYLMCPSDFCAAKPDAVSPVYEGPVATLRDRWSIMIARQPRVEQIAVSADGLQYDFIQRSLVMRFPDTITVRFIPLNETQSTLAIYSRSHYGYSDLGVNRQRIEAWLKALQEGT